MYCEYERRIGKVRKRDPKIIRVIAALLAVVMFIAQIGESVPAF